MALEPWVLITVVLVALALAVVIWRSAWIVFVVIVGAILGAAVFLPSEEYILDGNSDCGNCGYYISLRIGGSVRGEYYGALVALGATLGAFLAVGAWALRRKLHGWGQRRSLRI